MNYRFRGYYITASIQLIFLSTIPVIRVIFWIQDNFCIISNCINLFNGKFKMIINRQSSFCKTENVSCGHLKHPIRKISKHYTFTFIKALYVSWFVLFLQLVPASQYLFKVNNRNTRIRCDIYSKLTLKTHERRNWHCSGVVIVNFEHMLHLV